MARNGLGWREPVYPVDWWIDPDHKLVTADGRIRDVTVFQLKPSDIERIKAGYVCCECFNQHERPLPERCEVCKFPMRERQAEQFARNYRGNIRNGGDAAPDEDQIARVQEIRERELLGASGLRKQGRILVPRGI